MTPVLKIENLHVYYGGSHVLQGVNLELENGVAAIIGRNGMGKTTMANAIMGLVPTREGKVFINGDCITGKQPYEIARKGIGYVPQGRKIFPSLSVDEHLRFAERPVENGWDAERVYEFFPRLKERYKQSGTNLSGGVVLLVLGGAGGWFARKVLEAARRGTSEPETDAAREAERVRAERQAFAALMGYNAETAYGMQDKEE